MSTNKRIRYAKSENGTLKSRRNYSLPDNRQVSVVIDPIALSYSIVDAADLSQVVLSRSGETRNLAVLKIKSKSGLEELGVVFSDDVRVRKAKV